MSGDRNGDDIAAIKALIARQFASLDWSREKTADWAAFARDFLPGAPLYASARPARAQTAEAFVERMKGLAATTLPSFRETVLGSVVHVFGNVAVAVAACENTENETEVSRNVEMLLLVKSDGRWQVAAQAWDKASDANPVPDWLRADRG
jgi:hypothetical protein